MDKFNLDDIELPFVNATQKRSNEDIIIAFKRRNIELEFIMFNEEELFPNENTVYPLFPFLVVEKGSRESKPVIKDEVKNLYWI